MLERGLVSAKVLGLNKGNFKGLRAWVRVEIPSKLDHNH
jgi:hypothetical protein